MVESLTRVINRKLREDRDIEEELDLPFYIPSTNEALDEETYFCALRMAIKQLDLMKRVLTYDLRVKGEVIRAVKALRKPGTKLGQSVGAKEAVYENGACAITMVPAQTNNRWFDLLSLCM